MWRLRNVWLTLYNRTIAYYVLFIYIFYAKVFSWYNKGLQTINSYSGKEKGRHDVEYVDSDCCLTPRKRAIFIWAYIIMTISSFWRFSISPTQWAGFYTAIAFEETMGVLRGLIIVASGYNPLKGMSSGCVWRIKYVTHSKDRV